MDDASLSHLAPEQLAAALRQKDDEIRALREELERLRTSPQPLTTDGSEVVTADSDKTSSFVKSENIFVLRPFLLTYVGTWLILIGCLVLLISNLFLQKHYDESTWLSMWAAVTVTIGALLYAITSFINQQLLVCYGANILFVGLVLFTAALIWEVNDMRQNLRSEHPEKYRENLHSRANLSISAVCVIIFAVLCFARKGFQRIMRPYFGPRNYNPYGALIFGAGAFCYMIIQIKHTNSKIEVTIPCSFTHNLSYLTRLFKGR
jgi:hypothetical protein